VRAHGRSKRRMSNHRRKNAAFFATVICKRPPHAPLQGSFEVTSLFSDGKNQTIHAS